MEIGVPRETSRGEKRVAVTPEVARKLISAGHIVKIASGAGAHASAFDGAYTDIGAQITDQKTAMGCEVVLNTAS